MAGPETEGIVLRHAEGCPVDTPDVPVPQHLGDDATAEDLANRIEISERSTWTTPSQSEQGRDVGSQTGGVVTQQHCVECGAVATFRGTRDELNAAREAAGLDPVGLVSASKKSPRRRTGQEE